MVGIIRFLAKSSKFFAVFDSLVAIRTRLSAQKSRSGHFGVDNNDNDDNNNNRRTNRLLYPLLRMRARGKNVNITFLSFVHFSTHKTLPMQPVYNKLYLKGFCPVDFLKNSSLFCLQCIYNFFVVLLNLHNVYIIYVYIICN